MPDPTYPRDPAGAPWFLSPDDLAGIRADADLIESLRRGDDPDPADPLTRHLAAWLAEARG